MPASRKITIEIPTDLLAKAQEASGAGVTATVRQGLRLVAAGGTYARLRELRGRVRLRTRVRDLKADRQGA